MAGTSAENNPGDIREQCGHEDEATNRLTRGSCQGLPLDAFSRRCRSDSRSGGSLVPNGPKINEIFKKEPRFGGRRGT